MSRDINLRVGIDAKTAVSGAEQYRKAGNMINSSSMSIIKTLGKVFISIKALQTAFNFLKDSTNLFREQEKQERILESVIKATGSAAKLTATELKKYASELQELTSFGDEAILSAQSLFLTFKNIQGEIYKRAIPSILDLSVVMKSDLNSGALQLGKALNDPILGVTALSRAGIQFTQDQKKMIRSFVETNQIAKAQVIILEELEGQVGGVAQAMKGTLDFAINRNSGLWGDLKEAIGEVFSPAYITLLDYFSNKFKTWTNYIEKNMNTYKGWYAEIEKNVNLAIAIIKYFGNTIKETFAFVIDSFMSVAKSPFTTFQYIVGLVSEYTIKGVTILYKKVSDVFSDLMLIVGQFAQSQLKLDANPFQNLIDKIDLTKDGLEKKAKQITDLFEIMNDNVIKDFNGVTFEEFEKNINKASKEWESSVKDIMKNYDEMMKQIQKSKDQNDIVYEGLERTIKVAGSGWNNFISQTLMLNNQMLDNFKNRFTDTIATAITTGKDAFGDFFNFIATEILRLQIAKQITNPLSDIISEWGGGLLSFADTTTTEKITPPKKIAPTIGAGVDSGISFSANGIGSSLILVYPVSFLRSKNNSSMSLSVNSA